MPARAYRAILTVIIAFGTLQKPTMPADAFLGVALEPVDPTLGRQLELPPALGLIVERVARTSPAERAGIQPTDILLRLNDQWLYVPEQLEGLLRGLPPEKPASLELIRAGARLKLEAALGVRATDPVKPSALRVTVMRASGTVSARALADCILAPAPAEPPLSSETPIPASYAGLRLSPVSPAVLTHLPAGYAAAAVVLEVAPNSPAQFASLEVHDVIVELDHRPIRHPDDVFVAIRTLQPQAQLLFTVLRQSRPMELTVRLAARPADLSPRFDRTIDAGTRRLPPFALAADADWLIIVKPPQAGSPLTSDSPMPTEPTVDVVEAGDMTIRLEGDPLHRQATVTDARGALIFRGGITTAADRRQMPPNVWGRIAELIDLSDLSPRVVPQLESDQMLESRASPEWL